MIITKNAKKVIVSIIAAAMILAISMSVFAIEPQNITLDEAKVGVYYEQYIDMDVVIENVTLPSDLPYDVTKLSIHRIDYDKKQLPPGLEITNTARSAKFSGIPTAQGTYVFKVTVIGAYQASIGGFTTTIPLENMPVVANVTINVLPGEIKPVAPVITTKPAASYSVPVGSSITVSVGATCAEGCNYKLYIKRSDVWTQIDSKTQASTWDIKPLDSAGVKNTVGSHEFKVVAENAADTSLTSETLFVVNVQQKSPTYAVISGNTQLTEDDKLALVCTSDGDNLTYKWQIKTSNSSSWSDIGKNESALTVSALLSYNGGKVRCTVSNAGGSVTSDEVTLKISPKHTCSYDKINVIREANCTVGGQERHYCSCGKFITKDTNPLGHKFSTEWTVEIQPGCLTTGLKSHRCERCREQTDKTDIEAKGHLYGEWKVVKQATTTEEGIEQRTCANCGNIESKTVAKVVAGHEHSFSNWEITKNPTCNESGSRKRSCSCGEVETEMISPTGHDFSNEYTVNTEATCTEGGSKSRKCTKCDAEVDKTAIAPKGHDYGQWSVFKEATTQSDGEERRNCQRCDHYESKTIAKLVEGHTHSFGEWMIVTEAGCENSGLEMHACSCGSAETREISPKGHVFDSWSLIVAPTKEKEGIEIRRCVAEGCGKSESKIINKLSADAYVTLVPTPTPTPETTLTPDVTTEPTHQTPPTTGGNTGGTDTPSGDNSIIIYVIIGVGGVIILLLVMVLASRKKTRWG